jgi:malonyl-CoA O-methyltransferase
MHDIGDGLVRAGLADPVLDVDRLGVSYENTDKLFADLTRSGGRNTHVDRGPGLVGKAKFRAMTEALTATRPDGKILLDLELVYGHCWGSGPRKDPANFRVAANKIPLRR